MRDEDGRPTTRTNDARLHKSLTSHLTTKTESVPGVSQPSFAAQRLAPVHHPVYMRVQLHVNCSLR